MPDPFELPRVLGAIVPHMGGERSARLRRNVVSELVALPLRHSVGSRRCFARRESRLKPGLSAVIGTLNYLSEPSARLRRINSIRIRRRSFQVIHLPPREMRPIHLPVLAFSIRRQDKSALPRSHQDSYSAHRFLLNFVIVLVLLLVIECNRYLFGICNRG